MKPGEIVVSADFSENYAFVLQDAAQGFHWNNAQATIHPFCCVLQGIRRGATSELCGNFRLFNLGRIPLPEASDSPSTRNTDIFSKASVLLF